MIQLPRILKNMNLFVDGTGYAGRIDELQLPDLTTSTEEHRAGGMDAPIQVDMGMDAMEAEFTLSDFDENIHILFGMLEQNEVPCTVRGSIQAQGTGEAQPVVANLRGGFKTMSPGTWKPGDKNTLTITMALRYYKLTINSVEVVLIDIPKMIRTVNGTDQLAQQRAQLGI